MAAAPRSPKRDLYTSFHQLSSKLLTPSQRNDLHRRLQAYQRNRDVAALVRDTSYLWSSPKKLQLLPFVRKLMAVKDRPRFDALLGVHEGLVVGGAKHSRLHSYSSSLSSSKSGSHPLGRQGGIHVIKIHNTTAASPRMGFSIRGGSEFGLGVFVSQVEPRSPAEAGGLRSGDQILEASGVDLENATSARAAELLGGTLIPTLIVRRTRKVPEWKVTKERILWYDVATKKLVVIPSGEVTSVKHPGAQRTEVTERRVVLKLVRKTDFIGINVRGGKEYGLGIYVSRVDKGGVAERAGIKVGDQLVQVNGHRLDDVTHPTSVDLLRSSKQLVITAWAVGRFPAYKELFSEYVWSDSDDTRGDSHVHTAELHLGPVAAPRRKVGGKQLTHRTRTKETRVDRASRSRSSRYDSGIVLNGIDGLHIGDDPAIDYDDDPEDDDYDHLQILRPELFFPRDQDIIFRENYSENWRQLDRQHGEISPKGSSTAGDRKGTHNYHPKIKAAALNSDSDSSDLDMDYTTFLERKMRRDEGRLTTSSVISSEGNVEGEGRNGTRFVQSQSPKVTAEFTVNDDVGHSDVYAVVHKPPRSGQRLKSANTGQSSAYTVSHTTGESERRLDSQSGAAYEASPHAQRHSENLAYVPHATDQRKNTYIVTRDNYTVSSRTVSSEQRHDSRAVQPDVYAVVQPHKTHRKDSETHVTLVEKAGDGSATKHAMEDRFAKAGMGGSSTSDYYSHSANDNNSNTSRSSGSDQGAVGVAKAPRGHRTYVYHINGSPAHDAESEPVTVVRSQAPLPPQSVSTFRGNNTIGDHYEVGGRGYHTTTTTTNNDNDNDKLDDDYTLVAEVLNEMTTSFGAVNPKDKSPTLRHHYSPPDVSLMPGEGEEDGEGSSASSRSVTPPITPVTLTSVRPGGEHTTLELLNAEIRRLEERKSNLGSREIFTIAPTEQATPQREKKAEPEPEKKVGAWTNLKKKLTGSFRVKKGKKTDAASSPASFSMGSVRKKGVFERTFGSQMMSQHSVDKYNMMMVEERARQLLNKDECVAVLKHIKTYHDNKQLDRLVELLLTILDRPEKLQLLKDIRGVIYPYHVGRFDSLVASHEVTSYETLSTKLHLPLSPVHRQDSGSKPRTKLMTTVLDTDGHFHIKSLDQHDYDTQLQSQVVTTLQHSKSRPFDTSPAITTITTSNSVYNNNIYTSSNNNYSNSSNNIYTSSSNNKYEKRKKSGVTSPVHVVPPPIEWRDDIKVIIVEKEPPPPPPPPPPQPVEEEGITVYVSKQKKNLGLIVCGGAGDHMDPSVRIDLVMPWGAAADDDRIKAGMHILSVDGQSVKGMTQSEAIAVLKRCFHDTKSVNMKLVLKHP